MKKILVFVVTFISFKTALSQIGLGITTPHPNAYFQINSTNKGVLLPRMTAFQRLAIAPTATANGLIVFDTDSTAYMFWTGTIWKKVGGEDGNWVKNGNDIYNSNTGQVGIGTSNPLAKLHVSDGSVAFSSSIFDPFTNTDPAITGSGYRTLWYPEKAAFRTGGLNAGFATYWDRDSIGLYSFAAGLNTKAKGTGSVALGFQSAATGDYATAFSYSTASGNNSFSTGTSTAAGFGAVAVGSSTASGVLSIAAGNSAALGYGGTALGISKSVGDYSISAGLDAVAIGTGSVSIGLRDSAVGIYSFAVGRNCVARSNYSFASGFNSSATGLYAVGMGSSIANGDYSFAGGFSFATGISAIAMGSARATGNAAAAMGFGYSEGVAATSAGAGVAYADYAVAIGKEANAYGYASTCFGWNTFSRARGAATFGMFNDISDNPSLVDALPGDRLFQIGNGNDDFTRSNALTILRSGNTGIGTINPTAKLEVNGNIKIVDGTQAAGKVLTSDANGLASWQNTSGSFWTANGNDIYNNNTGNVGIGTSTPVSPLSFASNLGNKISLYGSSASNQYGMGIQGSLLQIYSAGVGDDIAFGYGSSSSFTERMRIKGNGNVGVGVSDPVYRLDVNGRMRVRSGGDANSTAGIWLNNNANNVSPAFVGMESDDAVGFYGSGTPNGWGVVMKVGTGNVGIGTSIPSEKLHVIGNILATGTITPSDIRYKNSITTIQNPLLKLAAIHGVTYFMNRAAHPEWQFDSTLQYGLIAQEVEKVFPEIVKTISADGYKGLDYVKLVPVLLEGIKELDKKTIQLTEENQLVRQRLTWLEEKVNTLLNEKTVR